MPLNIFPLGSFSKKKNVFPSSTSTKRSWPRHVLPDPMLEKAAGEPEQAGHLGGLHWIKSYFQRVLTCATRPGKRPWYYGRTHYSEPLSTRPHAAGTTGPPVQAERRECEPELGETPCWERTKGTEKDQSRLWSQLSVTWWRYSHVTGCNNKRERQPRVILHLSADITKEWMIFKRRHSGIRFRCILKGIWWCHQCLVFISLFTPNADLIMKSSE